MVRWEPPPLEYQNGVITGYKLKYRKQGKKGVTVTTSANERWYVLNDLERGAEYQVKLWAININGTSPPSEWITVETYKNDLDESRVPDEPGPLRGDLTRTECRICDVINLDKSNKMIFLFKCL